MALATRKGEGVAVRSVNVYTYNVHFYFVIEADSNKYKQIMQNSDVALSIDAIQIEGSANALEHPCDPSNKAFAQFVEEKLLQQFEKYDNIPVMRLIQVTPCQASLILLNSGEGYSIHYLEKTADAFLHDLG